MEHPKVATRSLRDTHPIDQPKKIAIDLQFNAQQSGKLKFGNIPLGMDDKWFIFYEDGWLYFHRSWTGFCTYKAELLETPEGYSIKEFWAERNPEKYKNTDAQEDIDAIVLLIAGRLLDGDISNEIRTKYIIRYQ